MHDKEQNEGTAAAARNAPFTLLLKRGTYYWCSCGKSEIAPYCDGSHSGTGKKPREFIITTFQEVRLCGCGRTETPPYCDESHAR